MPAGDFEQDADRVLLSPSWSERTSSVASGGTYVRNNFGATSNAWFPFTGESVTFQALAYSGAGKVRVLIDGQFVMVADLYSSEDVTRTFSYGSLSDGPHVLQVQQYRGYGTVDAFRTPGSAPFYAPLERTGIVRYEEDDLALLYNGVPFTRTSTTWNVGSFVRASDGYVAWSETAGDVVSMTFEGTWVGVGFVTRSNAGHAEVFIDGVSQGVVDTYSRGDDVRSVYYRDLVSGTHVISVTVLGTHNAYASDDRIYLDYIDVWDGTSMPAGDFEQDADRVLLSPSWSERTSSVASGGTYVRNNFGATSNAWFPFTGESVTFQALAYSGAGKVRVLIDGQFVMVTDLYNSEEITRTFSYGSLSAGPHVLQVQQYRGYGTVDAFRVPADPPPSPVITPTGVIRYEEDDPVLRYNGVPFTRTSTTWGMIGVARSSGGYAVRCRTESDTLSLTFEGRWVSLGFLTEQNAGMAEIFIDGVSQGVVNTYDSTDDVLDFYYPDLITGTHTLSITVLGDHSSGSSDDWVYVDYVDIWDGTPMPEGRFEASQIPDDGQQRVYLSADWSQDSDPNASNGEYVEDGTNAWFLFTGDSVDYLALSSDRSPSVEVFIDGISQGVVDSHYDFSPSPLAFHYTDLGPGAHVLHVAGVNRPRIDTFDTSGTPFVGVPMVEWWASEPTGGVFNTAAAGDLDGDGSVEIVVTSYQGGVYVYRGDGSDAGDGSPLIWSADLGGEPDSPTLADLDGQPGAEIIVGSPNGLYAFHHDGSLYWFTDTVKSTWRAASVANMDADPEPEIVTTGSTGPSILNHDGSLVWQYTLSYPLPPLLADMNGDGELDILTGDGQNLYLFDGLTDTPVLSWTLHFTSSIDARGTPAIADVDGQLPGGDPGPEIALVSNGAIHLVDADGTLLWSYPTGEGAPGGVSIADTDGDGEVEIVASAQVDGGRLYVLNADGSLLWDAPALDGTSANSGSVIDLDGDGIWEVVWNGDGQGLTIFRGDNGEILFNESLIHSQTRMDYPIIADVDQDGIAEIVTGDYGGVYVVGHDAAWAPSRPLWNEYNYHVTNVADDLSIPPVEPNSWEVHNTYRTQTPLDDPAPRYRVELTHTVPLSNVTVLTNTFSTPPDTPGPAYHWSYQQYWYQPARTTSFEAELPDMQAGEVRQISLGTDVAYRLASGENHLTLPALYVVASHIIDVVPTTHATNAGGTVPYNVTLYNPPASSDVYTLTLAGLPDGWATGPLTVPLAAGAEVVVPVTVNVPPDAELGDYLFAAAVDTASGGRDVVQAQVQVLDLLEVDLTPALWASGHGGTVSYTFAITNFESVSRTYTLNVVGLESNLLDLPATLEVAAGATATTTLGVTALAPMGTYPFQVMAVYETPEQRVEAGTDGTLVVYSERDVDVVLDPSTATGGRGAPAIYTVTVTNTGSLADTYDLTVGLPAGWSHSLRANGTPLSELTLTPHLFNAADVQLLVIPAEGSPAGSYPITVTATSQTDAGISADSLGTTVVSGQGVTVQIDPQSATMDPDGAYTWDVMVTNTGVTADTFELTAGGIVSATAQFDLDPVSLDAGASMVVQLTAADLHFALPQSYPFAVTAQSHADPQVLNWDMAEVTFNDFEAVDVAFLPASQTVTHTYEATYLTIITNTGNVDTIYALEVSADPALNLELMIDEVYIPPHMAAGIPLRARAAATGTYALTLQVDSVSSAAAAEATGTLIVVVVNRPPAAVDDSVTTDEDTPVVVDVLANDVDPDGDTLSVAAVTSGTHGAVVNGGTVVTYMPDVDYCGGR